MPTYDADTLRFYEANVPDYSAAGPQGTSRHLMGFIGLLPAHAKVLDLGCGSGRDAKAMLNAGFEVDPTDGSPAMARLAQKRLGQKVGIMRFDELQSFEKYDGVWASASLLHVPRPSLPAILSLVHRALKPGGVHCASYKAGGLEGRDSGRRYFNYLTREEVVDAYRASGQWQINSVVEYEGGGYETGSGPWVAVTLTRA